MSLKSALLVCTALLLPVVARAQAGKNDALKRTPPPAPTRPACAPVPTPPTPTDAQRRRARDLAQNGRQAAILGDSAAAFAQMREASQLDPTDGDLAYQLARAYETAGSSANAAKEYCRFLAIAPNAPEAGEARSRVATLAPPNLSAGPTVASALFDAGVAAYERKQLAEAEAKFGAAITAEPTWADSYYDRALVRIAQGDPRRAQTDFEEYLRLKPQAPDRAQVVARIETLRQRPLSARTSARPWTDRARRRTVLHAPPDSRRALLRRRCSGDWICRSTAIVDEDRGRDGDRSVWKPLQVHNDAPRHGSAKPRSRNRGRRRDHRRQRVGGVHFRQTAQRRRPTRVDVVVAERRRSGRAREPTASLRQFEFSSCRRSGRRRACCPTRLNSMSCRNVSVVDVRSMSPFEYAQVPFNDTSIAGMVEAGTNSRPPAVPSAPSTRVTVAPAASWLVVTPLVVVVSCVAVYVPATASGLTGPSSLPHATIDIDMAHTSAAVARRNC